MRVLIDTNILINLEDPNYNILEEAILAIARISSSNNVQLLYHPKSLDDINSDKNESRKQSMFSRVKKYEQLETSGIEPDDNYLGLVGERTDSKSNEKIDNHILFSVYSHQVNFLVTEDKGIHKKSKRLGLDDQVFYARQFYDFLGIQFPDEIEVPSDGLIVNKYLHELQSTELIFSSIRKDYAEFDTWYSNAAQSGRKAWAFVNKEGVQAICIYKLEENPLVTDDHKGLSGKVLKLSTFKVAEKFQGKKIGEALLRLALTYAVKNSFHSVYLTVRNGKHDYLESFLYNFGFSEFGITRNGDDLVLVKRLETDESITKAYPLVSSPSNYKSHLIPIKPEFHSILLGACDYQQNLFNDNSARQAIRKAYICNSNSKKISDGDLIFFYKTEAQQITSLGIVESVVNSNDYDEILGMVAKRTVYSNEEIQKMATKGVKVILFLFVDCSDKIITLRDLVSQKILNGHPQSITEISDKAASYLIGEGGYECYFLSD